MNATPILSLGLLCAGPSLLSAQDLPFHANLRDSLDIGGAVFSDVWGLEDRAYVGRFGQARFDLINMANPDNLSLTSTAVIPAPNDVSSAQDIKVARSVVDPSKILAFVSCESGGPDGIQIWDVTNQNSPSLLTTIDATPGSYSNTHNLSYREDGWLALCNSATSDAAIMDLRTYDPNNAPATLSNWQYRITGLGSGFVHDITLTDDYFLLAEWNSLIVYSADTLGTSAPAFVAQIGGLSCHAVWATPDSQFIVTTEERQGGATRLFELVDDGGSFSLVQRDSFVSPESGLGSTYSAHNPVMLDDRVYLSNYSAGTAVLQLDRTTKTLELVASFDTSSQSPFGFAGSWGVYPLLGHDRVLASDFDNGVFTIDFSGLQLDSAGVRPDSVIPGVATPVQVEITELGSAILDGASVELMARIDGGAFGAIPMVNVGGDVWEGSLPGAPCGSMIEYYFSAEAITTEEFTYPAKAPSDLFSTYSTVILVEVFSDDFSTDKGWTVTNDASLSTGAFERGAPVETGAQPGEDSENDAGNSCYMTENGAVGGSTSATDVDGGPTILTSPVLDFSSGDGLISYDYWAFSSVANANDALVVEIRDSGGASWTTVVSHELEAGAWKPYVFRVSDYVTPSATIEVRFRVQDNPNDSLTEAGVDNFGANLFCDSAVTAAAQFFNGTGQNPTCLSTSGPVIGQDWVSTVDNSIHPGAVLNQIVVYSDSTSGLFINAGEVLVDPGSLFFFQNTQSVTGSSTNHTVQVPADLSIVGETGTIQGITLGNGKVFLCNAYNLTVGF